jgi:hypothetical protein
MESRLAEINLKRQLETTEEYELSPDDLYPQDFLIRNIGDSSQALEQKYVSVDSLRPLIVEKLSRIKLDISQTTSPLIVNTLEYEGTLLGYQSISTTSKKISGYDYEAELVQDYNNWFQETELNYKDKIIAYVKKIDEGKIIREIVLMAESDQEMLEEHEKAINEGRLDPDTPLCFVSLKEELIL